MSAVDTAIRVLKWALFGSGPPPEGDLGDAGQLAQPNEPLSRALSEFATVNAARLSFSWPHQSLFMTSTVLAAALGALHTPMLARWLVTAASPSSSQWEWITHHGLLNRALPFFTGEIADLLDDFLAVSPLTAILYHPAQGRQADAFIAVRNFMHSVPGRNSLQRTLAEPSDCIAVLGWRQALLERLRLAGATEQDFVLDVYEAAMVHHRQLLLNQVRSARAMMDGSVASNNDAIPKALATAAWWGPLAALERSHPDALRVRRFLSYDYREGIALHRLAQRLRGGLP